MGAGRVVGLELLVDRGERGWCAGDADPLVRLRELGALERGVDLLADIGGQHLELARLDRVVGDVALGVAHRPDLERGVKADLGAVADDELGRAAADVEARASSRPRGARRRRRGR